MIEQNIAMDAGTARVSDDRANQGVLRMDQEEGVSAEEQAGRRLRSKQPARQARFGTSTQILCKYHDKQEPRVDTCIKNGGEQQVERKRSC